MVIVCIMTIIARYVPFSLRRDMKMKYGMRKTTGGAMSNPMYQSMMCFLPRMRKRESA
ncbi:hypothetical protein D3C83_329250 [compost metagenome]